MNQPYQRVSENNGVYDEALIGAAIGAGGAGAGVFGARMHYNGINNRHSKKLERLNEREGVYNDRIESTQDRYDRRLRNAGPRPWQKNKYNESLESVDSMRKYGDELENQLESSRSRDLMRNRQNVSSMMSDSGHNQNMDNMRREHRSGFKEINREYNDMIRDNSIDTKRVISSSDEGQYVDKISNRIDKRKERYQNSYNRSMDSHRENLSDINNKRRRLGTADDMRSRHAYSRMGGWRNAGIIGASALLGTGLGAAVGNMNE